MGRSEEMFRYRFGYPRTIIFERFDNKYYLCRMTNEEHLKLFRRNLSVDHIDGKGRRSKKINNNLNNLALLCLRCHDFKDRIRRMKVKSCSTKNFLKYKDMEAKLKDFKKNYLQRYKEIKSLSEGDRGGKA